MTIAEALADGSVVLTNARIAEPRREANSLLQFATTRDRMFVVAHPEYELNAVEAELYQVSIARRAAREPFQHIVGRQEFYGLDFIVTRDVLVPRPETELIVERAIELLADVPSPRFLEIGIGSGCISVAILKHSSNATAVAGDISQPAIDIAKRNVEMHGVSDRLAIVHSDIFDNIPAGRLDLIVSNPPYVPLSEYSELQPEVRDHDPRIAVTDGSTGLTIIEQIVTAAPRFLEPGGHLLMEIGHGQSEEVRRLMDPTVWQTFELIPDLQGIPRTLHARLI